ncbi:MAG: transcriptional regulator [Bdellovibrio sp. CG_4_9_14_3_um_filter_39_7]|nr:MAG: transcriptional regulator [Bdellovibrio sp. CG_4_9_14_3_um_filter_39_7]
MVTTDSLSLIFSALSDPTRRSILGRLAHGELSVTELAGPYEMSLPAITKHLKVLEKAKLITRGKEAQWRPCQLEAKSLKKADDWISTYRSHWEESFDRLDEYLKTIQKDENQPGEKSGKSKKRK